MNELFITFPITLLFIAAVIFLLVKRYNPQATLLFVGMAMILTAVILNLDVLVLKKLINQKKDTGFFLFDIVALIKNSLSVKGAGVGLMIMTIGGFVALMKHIGASHSLVYVSMKPLSIFKNKPYVAASLVVGIGQFLFICIPSAAGLGLLLMASIYPVLIRLNMSKLTAVSVITACTVFGIGPASANSVAASEIIGKSAVSYFIENQLKLAIIMTITLMILYYFVSKYYDRKENTELAEEVEDVKLEAPLYYAVLPILPLILLIVFSELFSVFKTPIKLDTTTALLITVFIAMTAEIIRKKSFKESFASLSIFWEGMGKIFASVVSLIIAAGIFADGLKSLYFVDNLIHISQGLGFGFTGIAIVVTTLVFAASILMGSGNAAFFAFGPLVPSITAQTGGAGATMLVSMQLSSSMGRAASPIAGVIIATSQLAGISPFDLAKRNLIPMISGLVFMFLYQYIPWLNRLLT